MTRTHLNALNTFDNKWKFGQASDPSDIVPCSNNNSSSSVPWKKRHMTYSTHPGLDIRQSPCWFKRVSFCYRRLEERTTHVRDSFTLAVYLSVYRRSFPLTFGSLIEFPLSRHRSIYSKHNCAESIVL
jgi:hypothetical protein